ncbi:MAG: hypothetical protein ABIJ61_11405, partial [bacterium]
MIGTIILAIYVIGVVTLVVLAWLLPATRLELLIASLVWSAGGGIYLLLRRLQGEREELATLTRLYLHQLELSLDLQNAGQPADKLLREFVDFCVGQFGVEKAVLLARRRAGFGVIDSQGLERKDVAGIRLHSRDDLIGATEQDRRLHDLARYYRTVRKEDPFAKHGLTHLLPIVSGKTLSYLVVFSIPKNHRLRLLRPFLLALGDQLGVYKRQEEVRSRATQQADKVKKQLANAQVELQNGHSGQELLSMVILEAQNSLAGVQTREQLYEAAFGLLKKRFNAGSAAFLGLKADSSDFTLLHHQGLKQKPQDGFALKVDPALLKRLENEQSGLHFGDRRAKESNSPTAKTLRGMGLQALYQLAVPKQSTVLLGVGGAPGSFSKEESLAIGTFSRLLSLVLANLSHLEKIEE